MIRKAKKSESVETNFSFRARLWKVEGPAGWCFVTVPKTIAKNIRRSHQSSEEGWGRLKSSATIGETTWKTAIWFDTKAGSYLLPIKALVRKKEGLIIGNLVPVKLVFEIDHWMLRSINNTKGL